MKSKAQICDSWINNQSQSMIEYRYEGLFKRKDTQFSLEEKKKRISLAFSKSAPWDMEFLCQGSYLSHGCILAAATQDPFVMGFKSHSRRLNPKASGHVSL